MPNKDTRIKYSIFENMFKNPMAFMFNDKDYNPLTNYFTPNSTDGNDVNNPAYIMANLLGYDNTTKSDIYDKYLKNTDGKIYGHRESTDAVGAYKGDGSELGTDNATISDLQAAGSMYGLMALGDVEQKGIINELLDPLSLSNLKGRTTGGDLGYFAEGGYAGNTVEYQTEGGEVMVLPDLSIIETAATKSHEKTPKNEVTDIIPEGTYVGSVRKEINKDDADKIVISKTSVKYKEGEKPKQPKQFTLGDIFTKKKEKVADLFEKVQKMFPVEEQVGDIATEETNQLNKMQREKYISAIINLAEMNKSPKKEGKINYAKEGGFVKNDNVPKADAGAMPWSLIAQGIDSQLGKIGSLWNLYQAGKSAKESKKMITDTYSKVRGLTEMGAIAGLGSVLAQNSEYTPPDLSGVESQMKSIPGKLPYTVSRSVNDSGDANMRNIADKLAENSSNYVGYLNGLSGIYGKGVESMNNTALDIATQNAALENDKTYKLADLETTKATNKADAIDNTRAAGNKKWAGIGSQALNYTSNLANLEFGETNANLAIKAALDNVKQTATNNMFSILGNDAVTAGSYMNSIGAKVTPTEISGITDMNKTHDALYYGLNNRSDLIPKTGDVAETKANTNTYYDQNTNTYYTFDLFGNLIESRDANVTAPIQSKVNPSYSGPYMSNRYNAGNYDGILNILRTSGIIK